LLQALAYYNMYGSSFSRSVRIPRASDVSDDSILTTQ
jgi:hypothetical protein